MKKLLLVLMFIVFMAQPCLGTFTTSIETKSTWKNAYRFTGKPKDKFKLWCNEVEDRIDGTTGVDFMLFVPGTVPSTAAEGQLYYDSTADKLKYRNGSEAWVNIEAASGNALDDAYDAGTGITVDNGAVTLTATDAANNDVLSIVQVDATGGTSALTLINAGTGATVEFDGNSTGGDILGSDSTWSVSVVGAAVFSTLAPTGVTTFVTDVTFDCTTDDGKDVEWDDSQEVFHFLDSTILGIGGATTAAPDIAIRWDETDLDVLPAATNAVWKWGDGTNDLDMWWYGGVATDYMWWDESGAELLFVDAHIGLADDGTLTFGTNDDWVMSSATDGILAITPDAQGNEIRFGSSYADAVVMTWYSDSNGDTVVFDEDNIMVEFEDVSIALGDSTKILFGDTIGTGDISIESTSAVLSIDGVTPGTGSVYIGQDNLDILFKWFGETASSFFQFTGDQLQCDGVQIALDDGDAILFGTTLGTGDFSISDATDVLLIQNVADGTGTVAFGATTLGIDVAFYGDGAGAAVMLWDENANTNGALILDKCDIEMGDGDFIQIGDGADLTISATTTTTTATMAAASTFVFADTDNTASKFTFGANGTHGLDILINGGLAGNHIVFDAGTGAETLTLTDVDLLCIASDTTDSAATFTSAGANTVSLAIFDGATSGAAWVGANDVGMVHIKGDGVPADAGASLLQVVNSAQPPSASEGFMARFVDTGTARTDAYAVGIQVTATTKGLYCDGPSIFAKGVHSLGQSITATGDGLSTGVTPIGASFVIVTSGNADSVCTLPAWVVGQEIYYYCGATGFELETPAGSDDTINTVDCDGTNQMAMVATSLYKAVCVADSTWILTGVSTLGALEDSLTPDPD